MRYCKKPLPPYQFIPGQTKHPYKEGGYLFGQQEPVSIELSDSNFHEHQDYLYAIDLYNHKFFWLSHVYLEAIWNANDRSGEHSILLKAIIQLCASNIKSIQENQDACKKHEKRALELLSSLKSELIAGIEVSKFKNNLSRVTLKQVN